MWPLFLLAAATSGRGSQQLASLTSGSEPVPKGEYDLPFIPAGALGIIYNAAQPVARAYDGRDWEGVGPVPLPLSCDAPGSCKANIPTDTFRRDVSVAASYTPDKAVA